MSRRKSGTVRSLLVPGGQDAPGRSMLARAALTQTSMHDRESDALLAKIQAAKVRRAMKTAFQASGDQLGKAAVPGLWTRGK